MVRVLVCSSYDSDDGQEQRVLITGKHTELIGKLDRIRKFDKCVGGGESCFAFDGRGEVDTRVYGNNNNNKQCADERGNRNAHREDMEIRIN